MGSVSGPGSLVDADTLFHPELILLPFVVKASCSRAPGLR